MRGHESTQVSRDSSLGMGVRLIDRYALSHRLEISDRCLGTA
jgi:hypothetical protein